MAINSPKITVIIPIFNAEKYLKECLDSIINQTFTEIEILCINDGSTDASEEIINDYIKSDLRIRLISRDNRGVSFSRNEGIRSATGQYITFMDADDFYPSIDILEALYKAVIENDVFIAGGEFSELNLDGSISAGDCFRNSTRYYGYCYEKEGLLRYEDYQFDYGYHRFIYNKDFLISNSIEFPPFARFQDPPFMVRALAKAEEFYALKKITYRYRAENKVIEWDARKLSGLANGLVMNLDYADEHNLLKLHELTSLRMSDEYRWHMSTMAKMISEKELELFIYKKEIEKIETINVKALQCESLKSGNYMGIKAFLQNRLPATRRFVERRLSEQDSSINKIINNQQELIKRQEDLFEKQERLFEVINKILAFQNLMKTNQIKSENKIVTEIVSALDSASDLIEKNFDQKYIKYEADIIKKICKESDKTGACISDLSKNIQIEQIDIKDRIEKADRASKETLFANVFHDTILNSTWLVNKRLSPGRWAIGYPGLYVLYRILDEIKPKSILELGLGQSTELITQYAKANSEVSHYVTEHDDSWIHFFTKTHTIAKNTKIVKQEIIHTSYKEDNDVITYKNFTELFKDKKFDLVFIDAPLGGLAKVYARIDILGIIPESLAKQFVIVIDDYNRIGEKRMTSELEKIFTDNDIDYYKGRYTGEKDTLVIASEKNKWVCSM